MGCVNCCNRNKQKAAEDNNDDDEEDEGGFLIPVKILRISLVDSGLEGEKVHSAFALDSSRGMATFRTSDPRTEYDFVLTKADFSWKRRTDLYFVSNLLSGGHIDDRHREWLLLPLAYLKQFESVTKLFRLNAKAWVKVQLAFLPSPVAATMPQSRPAPEAALSIVIHQVKANRPIVPPQLEASIVGSATNCFSGLLSSGPDQSKQDPAKSDTSKTDTSKSNSSKSDPSAEWVARERRMLLAVQSVNTDRVRLWLLRGDWSETHNVSPLGEAVVAVSDLVDVCNHKIKLEEGGGKYDEEGNSFEVVISAKLFFFPTKADRAGAKITTSHEEIPENESEC